MAISDSNDKNHNFISWNYLEDKIKTSAAPESTKFFIFHDCSINGIIFLNDQSSKDVTLINNFLISWDNLGRIIIWNYLSAIIIQEI